MDIIKLITILVIIIIVLRLNGAIHVAISIGALATILLYNIGFIDILNSVKIGVLGENTINVVLAIYSITFLQRMLEKRDDLILAERSLTNIFNSRRINVMVAPFIIGLLPSPSAVLIASPIVDNAGGSI